MGGRNIGSYWDRFQVAGKLGHPNQKAGWQECDLYGTVWSILLFKRLNFSLSKVNIYRKVWPLG